MLNIASVNMLKIKPETKVLIIKTQSQVQVSMCSMCLNGRWRGATKRLATSMTDPGRADRARQLLETTACWSDCQKPGPCQPPHCSRRSGRAAFWNACFVKNCTLDSCSQWSPRSYCCPETSAKQETAKKPCCLHQGPQPDRRLDSRKVAKNVFF